MAPTHPAVDAGYIQNILANNPSLLASLLSNFSNEEQERPPVDVSVPRNESTSSLSNGDVSDSNMTDSG